MLFVFLPQKSRESWKSFHVTSFYGTKFNFDRAYTGQKKIAEEEDLPFTSRSAPLIDYKPWHAPKIAIQYADFTPFLWEMSPETG